MSFENIKHFGVDVVHGFNDENEPNSIGIYSIQAADIMEAVMDTLKLQCFDSSTLPTMRVDIAPKKVWSYPNGMY